MVTGCAESYDTKVPWWANVATLTIRRPALNLEKFRNLAFMLLVPWNRLYSRRHPPEVLPVVLARQLKLLSRRKFNFRTPNVHIDVQSCRAAERPTETATCDLLRPKTIAVAKRRVLRGKPPL